MCRAKRQKKKMNKIKHVRRYLVIMWAYALELNGQKSKFESDQMKAKSLSSRHKMVRRIFVYACNSKNVKWGEYLFGSHKNSRQFLCWIKMTTIKRIKSAIESAFHTPKPSVFFKSFTNPFKRMENKLKNVDVNWILVGGRVGERAHEALILSNIHMCERLLLDDFASIIFECVTMRFSIQQFNTWKWKVVCHFANAFFSCVCSCFLFLSFIFFVIHFLISFPPFALSFMLSMPAYNSYSEQTILLYV